MSFVPHFKKEKSGAETILDHGNMGVTLFTKLELYVFLCLITA
jgi:hypothetical protein